MGRLTRIFEKDNQKYVCIDVCGKKCVEGYSECHDCEPFTNVMKKLAEYEDLEEQGLLIKLPYKAGERVWILYKDKLIEENYVASIQIGEKYDRLCFADGYVYTIWNKDYEKVKKWVYTSKAEAEKALAEMEKQG